MTNILVCFLMLTCVAKLVRSSYETNAQNEINGLNSNEFENMVFGSEKDYNIQPYDNASTSNSWLNSAKRLMAEPAGQIVVHMAKEVISRSTGNSQILSLNLTNLFILVLLKALIFGAGLIGAGNWGQYGRARSYDAQLIQADEAPLFVGYLALEGSGNDGCLNLAACNAPETAKAYVRAGRAIIKGTEMFDKQFFNSTKDYAYTLNQLEQSIKNGFAGAPCDSIYYCNL